MNQASWEFLLRGKDSFDSTSKTNHNGIPNVKKLNGGCFVAGSFVPGLFDAMIRRLDVSSPEVSSPEFSPTKLIQCHNKISIL